VLYQTSVDVLDFTIVRLLLVIIKLDTFLQVELAVQCKVCC